MNKDEMKMIREKCEHKALLLEQKRLKEIVIAKIEHLADIEIRKDSTCEKYFDMVLDLLDKELEDNNEKRRK